MATYFFHIRDGHGVVPDEEGLDLRDMQAARLEGRLSALDIGTARIRSGLGVGAGAIDIADREGTVLEAISLRAFLN